MSIPGAASPLFIGAAAAAEAGYQIDRSLRFNDDDSAKLTRTFVAGNQSKWTWSGWVKRSSLGTKHHLFAIHTSDNNSGYFRLAFNADNTLFIGLWSKSALTSDAVYRDLSAWMHIVLVLDLGNSTAADKIILYVNGVRQSVTLNVGSDQNYAINSAGLHNIGSQTNTSQHFDGYMAEVHFVDGQALAASDFGEYDDNNVWQPKEYAGSYGTNGFYLKFADNSSNAALGTDSSGNSNTWTVNNLSATDGRDYTSEGSTSGSFYTSAGGAASKMFDGSASTGAFSQTGTATFTFGGSTITASSSLQVRAFKGDSSGANVLVNGTDISSLLNAQSGGGYSTVNITSTLGGAPINLSNVSLVNAGGGSGNIAQIFVDGVELIDGSASDNDSLIDTPTNYEAGSGNNNGGNYATLNLLDRKSTVSLSNGNLDATTSSTGWAGVKGTMGVSSGKYYFEATANGSAANKVFFGICASSVKPDTSGYLQDDSTERAKGMLIFCDNGQYQLDGNSRVNYSSSMADGDVIAIAYDLDGNTVQFYKNGSALGSIDISSSPLASTTVVPLYIHYNTNTTYHLNFGQRPFAYTPPTGHLSLCTTNLPDPTIADGSTAFETVLWTGDGTNNRKITTPFSPDFVWAKFRNQGYSHGLYDTVRGDDKRLVSNSTGAEGTVSLGMESDGFVVEGSSSYNDNNDSFVAWTWDGGSSTVSNTDGSITSNVRANPSAGFSIVSFTADGTAGDTVGHGLNAKPEFFIYKDTEYAQNWGAYHGSLGATYGFNFNTADAKYDDSGYFNDTEPTSSVITLGNYVGFFGTHEIIAYCFAPVEGYSAFGSYEGNGSADGPFVFTGFRPALVIAKRSSAQGDWIMHDTTRTVANGTGDNNTLVANVSNGEDAYYTATQVSVDYLSNGFKLRHAGGPLNDSSHTYIYAAFAEHPLKHARAR